MAGKAIFVLLMAGACAQCCGAKIHLESFAGNPDSIPIGIVSFKAQGDAAVTENQPWKIIADDLDFSGRFIAFKVDSFDTALFRKKNLALYIDGNYSRKGTIVSMNCFVRDAVNGDMLWGKKIEGEFSILRKMAHRLSDDLFDLLLNQRGIFESNILFVKDRGNTKEIMIMDYDGHDMRQLTFTNTVNILPVFADTESFLFTSFLNVYPNIYIGSIKTGKVRPLLSSRHTESSPSSSSITGKVAFASSRTGDMEIYVCDRNGGGLQRLTYNHALNTSPCWSPNGAFIAYTSNRDGRPRIYIMNEDGTGNRLLTYDGDYLDSPAWSPKGDKIACMSMINGVFQIWTIKTDGTNAAQVTVNPGSNENPAWSPDGSHIVFSRRSGGKSDLFAILENGSRLTRLTKTENAKMPAWSVY